MSKHRKEPNRRNESTENGDRKQADIHTNLDIGIEEKTLIKERDKKTEETKGSHGGNKVRVAQ